MIISNIVQPGRGHFVFPNKQELNDQGWMAVSPSSVASKTRKQVAKWKVGVFLPLSCQHTTGSIEVFRATGCSRATFAFQFLHFWCSFCMNFIMLKRLLPRIGFACCIKKIQTNKIQHWICCLVQGVELRDKPCLLPQRGAGNRFGASSHCDCLGDSGELIVMFNASPLSTVSATFKKMQKIGIPEAKCFVGRGNRRSSKGSVSSCPSRSASSPFEDTQQSEVGRNRLSRG